MSLKNGIHSITQTAIQAVDLVYQGMLKAGVEPAEAHRNAVQIGGKIMCAFVENNFSNKNAAELTQTLSNLGNDGGNTPTPVNGRRYFGYDTQED